MYNNYRSYKITVSSLLICYGVLILCFIPKLPIIGGVGVVLNMIMIISLHHLEDNKYALKISILALIISNFIYPNIIMFILTLISVCVSFEVACFIKKVIKNNKISIFISCIMCNLWESLIILITLYILQYVEYYKYILILMVVLLVSGIVSGVVVNSIIKSVGNYEANKF